MVWYVILCVLAGFGLLCAVWSLVGRWLGWETNGVLVCFCRTGQETGLIARYTLLRGAGILQCPMLLVGSDLSPQEQALFRQRHPGIEFCTLEEVPHRLELEREELD